MRQAETKPKPETGLLRFPEADGRHRQPWVGKRPLTKPCDRQSNAWKSTVAERPGPAGRLLYHGPRKLPFDTKAPSRFCAFRFAADAPTAFDARSSPS